MATATETISDARLEVLSALGDDTKAVSDLITSGVTTLALGQSWAAGDIEFGHRTYVVTGRLGSDNSTLVIEDGEDWTGPKTKLHVAFRKLWEEQQSLPVCARYRKYVKAQGDDGQEVLKPQDITKAEAHGAIALKVRLTDQGLAALGAA